MPFTEPLPQGVRALLAQNTHPGLLLDKYVKSWDPEAQRGKFSEAVQKPTVQAVAARSQQAPPGLDLPGLLARRAELFELLAATSFTCTTIGPLTLHLARASALENAGLCLHPLYGFAYLPATGLKGMARAYAETVWLKGLPPEDQIEGWRQIETVFGWAPGSDLLAPGMPKPWRPDGVPGHSKEDASCSGCIVFHDAWPLRWPKLLVDIVNNHHPDYYQAGPKDNGHPPGDWEDPVPVYFLAVGPGTAFSFAVTKRRDNVDEKLLELAGQWLLGALCHLGAGAKTAAGYGAFKPEADSKTVKQAQPVVAATWEAVKQKKVRAEFVCTLELVTPAFLAGADQKDPASCDFRSATLRGLLRWWWRTMHAGFVDVVTLRRMETAVWGDTDQSGPIRILIEPRVTRPPLLYDKRNQVNMAPADKASSYGIPDGNPQKTTQGLWYASFGMDETSRGERKQRYYLEPGCSWSVRLIARRASEALTTQEVLDQARAALWLLCTFGGVGSKARKGFGSLALDQSENWSLQTCFEAAARWRGKFNLPTHSPAQVAASSVLGQVLGPVEVSFPWPGVWHVLDQVGFAYQAFAKKYAHRLEKKALGLPHRIGPGVDGQFEPTGPLKKLLDEARKQRKEDNVRHASPVHIHLGTQSGRFLVRAIAFPAHYLPDFSTSKSFLEGFLHDVEVDLQRRAQLEPPVPAETRSSAGRSRSGAPSRPENRQQRGDGGGGAASPAAAQQSTGPRLPRVGDRVDAVLLEEKTRKGGWRAKHTETGIAGPIQNSAAVPADKKPGETVKLLVKSANAREIAFAWPD